MAFFGEKLIYSGRSSFARYEIKDMIYNGRPARVLFGGDHSSQSGVALDDNPELLFDYNQRFLEIAESIRPQSVLIIGGGAFTLPRVLIERSSTMTIDVVELDPLLPQLATDYFGLKPNDRLKIYTMDGLDFLRQSKKKYDLIILDAFFGYEIPEQLLAPEAVALYRRHISDEGYMAINFIASTTGRKTKSAESLWQAFEPVFHEVAIYPADANYPMWAEQNLIFVASAGLIGGLDYVQSVRVSL